MRWSSRTKVWSRGKYTSKGLANGQVSIRRTICAYVGYQAVKELTVVG